MRASNYWLIWDARALYSATATAEWFDALGLLAEPMVRNFLSRESVDDRLFSLFVFLHLGLPLALLAGMWIHVKRIGFPKNLPPAPLAWGTIAMLCALAVILPARSHAPADPSTLPRALDLDWFMLFAHPLMYATSPEFLWLLAGGATVVLTLLPWLARAPAPPAAVVDLANCNGCGCCVAGCPLAAVILVPVADRNHVGARRLRQGVALGRAEPLGDNGGRGWPQGLYRVLDPDDQLVALVTRSKAEQMSEKAPFETLRVFGTP